MEPLQEIRTDPDGAPSRLGTESAIAVSPSIVEHSHGWREFLARAMAYRSRVYPPTVKRVRFVRIEDEAARSQVGDIWVARLSGRVGDLRSTRSAAGVAPCRFVRLSAETAIKQVIHHPELTIADYLRVREVIEHGELFASKEGHRLVFFREFEDGRLYRAIVKLTDTNRTYLATFHRAKPHDLRAARQRAPKNAP